MLNPTEAKRIIEAALLASQEPVSLQGIRKLFEDIESKRELVQLLGAAEVGEGVRIFIGSENRLFSLSGSSIIVTPFRNAEDRKSTRLNSSHIPLSRMPSSA